MSLTTNMRLRGLKVLMDLPAGFFVQNSTKLSDLDQSLSDTLWWSVTADPSIGAGVYPVNVEVYDNQGRLKAKTESRIRSFG